VIAREYFTTLSASHSGVRADETMPAVLALLMQDRMSPSDEEIFTGLNSRQAAM
jgi:hypothetical protein